MMHTATEMITLSADDGRVVNPFEQFLHLNCEMITMAKDGHVVNPFEQVKRQYQYAHVRGISPFWEFL